MLLSKPRSSPFLGSKTSTVTKIASGASGASDSPAHQFDHSGLRLFTGNRAIVYQVQQVRRTQHGKVRHGSLSKYGHNVHQSNSLPRLFAWVHRRGTQPRSAFTARIREINPSSRRNKKKETRTTRSTDRTFRPLRSSFEGIFEARHSPRRFHRTPGTDPRERSLDSRSLASTRLTAGRGAREARRGREIGQRVFGDDVHVCCLFSHSTVDSSVSVD